MAEQDEVDIADIVDKQRVGPYQISLIIWLVLVMVVDGYDNQALSYAAPSMMKELSVSKAMFGVVFSSGLVGFIFGSLVLGSMADRFGRRPLIIAGLLIFGFLTPLAPFCRNLPELIATRALTGIGLGAIVPITNALSIEFAPRRGRSTRVALNFIGYLTGSSLGGLAAAAIMTRYGWPAIFYVGGLMAILMAITLILVLPESPSYMAAHDRHRQKLIAFLSRLTPDIAVTAGTRLSRSYPKKRGLPAKHLFTDGRALATLYLWIAFFGAYATQQFLSNWLPTILVEQGLSNADAIVAASMAQFGAVLGILIVGRLVDRLGVGIIGYCFIFGVLVIAGLGIALGSERFVLMAMIFAVGVIFFGAVVSLVTLSTVLYPSHIRSTGIGWAYAVSRVGSLLGVSLGGVIVSIHLQALPLFLIIGVPGLICGLAVIALTNSRGLAAISIDSQTN